MTLAVTRRHHHNCWCGNLVYATTPFMVTKIPGIPQISDANKYRCLLLITMPESVVICTYAALRE